MPNFAYQLKLTSMLLAGLLVSLFATSPQDTTLNPIKWSLSVEPAQKEYKKGEKLSALVAAQIQEGWHLYSLEEIPNGPRPTRITLPDNPAFALAGEVEQPLPITKHDENFGVETQFYEEAATFTVPLKINANANTGETKLTIQVRYQTCNDHLCLPPKTVVLEAPLTIR